MDIPTAKESKRVLISGASIAGPAIAYWLVKYGFACTVVERAPALRTGGYAIDIRGAAVDVVKRMGLYDKVRAQDTGTESVVFVDKTGDELIKMDADAFGGRQNDDLEVMRGDLAAVLYEATKDSVQYIWNDTITELEESGQGVRVTFERGEPQTFDIVIGADGLHSTVRQIVWGDEDQFVRPLGAYISIATIPNYLGIKSQEVLFGVVGKSIGAYTANNNRDLKAMFLFSSKPIHYDRHSLAEQKQILADIFANEKGWETVRFVDEMSKSSDFYFDFIAQTRMNALHKGRVALVGDAAYCPSPASGQGTSMALVGAYVLAGELKNAGGDYSQAFDKYQHAMHDFIAQNLKIAPATLKGMIAPSKFNLGMRNVMFRMPKLFIGMNRQVMQFIQKAANSITLKDYER